jgi:hypothetical protein
MLVFEFWFSFLQFFGALAILNTGPNNNTAGIISITKHEYLSLAGTI